MEDLHLGSSSKQKKQNRPFINVISFEPVTKKVVISSDSSALLADYTSFMSLSKDRRITEDAVLDALILKLNDDREFLKWRKNGHILGIK